MSDLKWMRQISLTLVAVVLTACSDRSSPAPVAAPLPAEVDSLALASSGGTGSGAAGGDYLPAITRASFAAESAARIPRHLTLADIGYRDGLTLNGATDAVTLAVPVNPGTSVTLLSLRLLPTPGMPTATFRLSQRNRILGQWALTDSTTSLTLDLSNAQVDAGKATVELSLVIPEPDACLSELYYRTVILPESEISYYGIPGGPGNLADFFPPWLERVTVYLADDPSLDAAQATLDAATFVGRRYRGMSTVFEVKPLPEAGVPLSEPGPWSRAIIWSPEGETHVVRPDSGRGTIVALAARRDSRQLFSLVHGDEMVNSDAFRGNSVSLEHQLPDSRRGVVTLADLGYEIRTIEGSSNATASYTFSLADLGAGVAPVSLRLIAQHSGVPTRGNGTLQVLLNGALIHSRPLDRRSIDQVISLPAHLLERENTLDIRFQIIQPDGECRLGGATFTATIDPVSSLVIERGQATGPGFARFPAAFVPAVSVLLEPRDRYRVELAATVLGEMQQTTRSPLAPALARDRESAIGPLLAIGGSSLAEFLVAPVHSDSFALRDRDGRVWDEFTPATPFAAMQGWERGGRDILLLHHTGADGQPLSALLDEATTPYGWFGVRGDLALRGSGGTTHLISAANAGWRLDNAGPAARSMADRYRSVIFIVAALILLVLLIWLYPRVVRRELDTTG